MSSLALRGTLSRYKRQNGAQRLIKKFGAQAAGLAIDFTDMSMVIIDPTTAANNFVGNPNDKLTYTSPTAKYIELESGLWASASTLRCEYSSGVPLGLHTETSTINRCLHNRDLTNAAWTKTNGTAAKDQVGVDGVANSASSLTATSANATALQSITNGSNSRIFSAFVKRITGSGAIEMTMDNGGTWTAVTSSIGSSWARVNVPNATVTNPIVGFRIVTSGDAIAVDFAQEELGAFATSPVATTTLTVTRAVDNITIATTLFPYVDGGPGSLYAFLNCDHTSVSASAEIGLRLDGNNYIRFRTSSFAGTAATVAQWSFALSSISTTYSKRAMAWDTNDAAGVLDSGTPSTDGTVTIPTGMTALHVAYSAIGINGHIKEIVFMPRRMSNADMRELTRQ